MKEIDGAPTPRRQHYLLGVPTYEPKGALIEMLVDGVHADAVADLPTLCAVQNGGFVEDSVRVKESLSAARRVDQEVGLEAGDVTMHNGVARPGAPRVAEPAGDIRDQGVAAATPNARVRLDDSLKSGAVPEPDEKRKAQGSQSAPNRDGGGHPAHQDVVSP